MNPTNAGLIPNVTAASCTDSTKISLTSATSTVTPASVARASPIGHGASPASPDSALAKNSRCVLSENSIPNPYAAMSSTDKPRLNSCMNAARPPESATETADGISSATVARNSSPA